MPSEGMKQVSFMVSRRMSVRVSAIFFRGL